MRREKKGHYEYIKSKKIYRKRLKDADGEYTAIYGRTIEELERKIETFMRQVHEIKFHIENPTVEEYAAKWLGLQENKVKETTLIDYRSLIKIYIIGIIGNKYMCQVKPDDAALCISKAAGKSKSVCHKTGMLLKKIFKEAYKNHLINENPCNELDTKGGTPPTERVPLTDQQVEILLNATANHRVGTFIAIGLYSGLRREEILGLKWENVDLESDNPSINVRLAWYTLKNRPYFTEKLKNQTSRRTVPIPKCLVEILKKSKKKYPSEYVVPNKEGGPMSGTQWRQLWEYVKKRTTEPRYYYRKDKDGKKRKHLVIPKLGEYAPHNKTCQYVIDFHVTPHILRHTYITNLLEKGVDVKTVQHLAGHKSAKITMEIYAHLKYNKKEDIAKKINKAFGDTN